MPFALHLENRHYPAPITWKAAVVTVLASVITTYIVWLLTTQKLVPFCEGQEGADPQACGMISVVFPLIATGVVCQEIANRILG